ncbi:MAG: hypothetical protein HYY44_04750 [Deltaproteobacteria bacterium]|nr:hypothetical protein [Deltaproteobacteria bacterium]
MSAEIRSKQLDYQTIRETAFCLLGGAGALALNEIFNPRVNFRVLSSPNSFSLGLNPAMGIAKIVAGFSTFILAPALVGGVVGAGNGLITLRDYPEMTTKDQEVRDLIRADAHVGLILNGFLHVSGTIVGLWARFTPRFWVLYGAAVVTGIAATVTWMPQLFFIPAGSDRPIPVEIRCREDKCTIQNRRKIEEALDQTIPLP